MQIEQTILILAQPQGSAFFKLVFPLLIVFLMIYFFVLRPERQKRRRQDAMLKQLKKNDRVLTIGGMSGTIVDVRDEEIILKVDENTNTKVRIRRWGVREVLTDTKEKERS